MAGIDDIFRDFSVMPSLPRAEAPPRMRVDIEETGQVYVLRAEVPGAGKENIQVSIDANRVTIMVHVAQERTEGRSSMIRCERYFGGESRTFTLPREIDESKAEARVDNGVLTLTLPKKSGRGGTRLAVH